MPVHIPNRSVRIATFAATILAASVSAFGQSGQSIAVSAQAAANQLAATAEPTGPVRQLSIDDATKLALEQNLGIRIQWFEPQIQDVSIWQSKSFWAPQLSTSV